MDAAMATSENFRFGDEVEWVEIHEPVPVVEPRRSLASVPVRDKPGERRELQPRDKPADVDFTAVPPSQWDIHDRLENWAKWCHGRVGRNGDASPMFGGHVSDTWEQREYGAATLVTVDQADATVVAKGVAALPERHRRALHWRYPKGARAVGNAARELAVSKQGLADLVRDARQMLLNLGV